MEFVIKRTLTAVAAVVMSAGLASTVFAQEKDEPVRILITNVSV